MRFPTDLLATIRQHGWILALGLLLLCVTSSQAHAQLKVQLGDVQLKNYKIAITNFRGPSALGKQVASVIKGDLKLTGMFNILKKSSFLEKAPRNGIEPNSFDFEPWRQISAQGLLKGSVKREGAGLLIQFRFYEVGSGKLAINEGYRIKSRKSLRWYLHVFAAKLYKYLTGEKAIFTTKVTFIRSHKGRQEVWIMDFDGNNPQRITNNGSINVLPAWSPNGKYIAYTSWKRGNPDLFVYNRFTGKTRKVSKFRGLNTGAAWSPDSKRIAFSASRGKDTMDIYVVGARGGKARAITRSKWGRNLSPSWSPSGKQIAFVSTRYGNPQIFVMNANGSGVKRLTRRGKYNQAPKWSPKGDWILFTGRDEKNRFDLFLVSPKNGQIKRLTQNQGNNLEASWSPNGRNIIFTSTRNGVAKLFIMTAEGKNARQISTLLGKYFTPSWSPWLEN